MSGAAELLYALEAAGVAVTVNAAGNGLKLRAATPPPAALMVEVRANKAALLAALLTDPLFLGQQPGRCGSCAHWTPGPWVAHMGFCDAGRKAHDFDGTTEPVETQIAHACVVQNGKGWRPR